MELNNDNSAENPDCPSFSLPCAFFIIFREIVRNRTCIAGQAPRTPENVRYQIPLRIDSVGFVLSKRQ